MNSRSSWSLALLLTLLAGSVARAQDPVLTTVDELTRAHRCEAALALLVHAQGTPAELAGRAALCEAELGQSAAAAAHVSEALRAPNDPWVVAHRNELLAALGTSNTTTPPAPVVPPTYVAPTPPGGAPAPDPSLLLRGGGPTSFHSAAGEPSDEPLPPEFRSEFASAEVVDEPARRGAWHYPAGRFSLGVIGTLGLDFAWDERFAVSGSPDPYVVNGTPSDVRIDCITSEYVDLPTCPKTGARIGAGLEVTVRLAHRLALAADVELGVTTGSWSTELRAYEYPGTRWYGDATSDFGFFFRVAPVVRVTGAGGRYFFGIGPRITTDMRWFRYELTPSEGTGSGSYTYVRREQSYEALLELGVAFGARRDHLLLLRQSYGLRMTFDVAFVVPFVRGGR